MRDGRLARLESGRDRGGIVEHLIAEASGDPDLVVGLDFAFSFPRWFAAGHGAASIEQVWALAAENGEEWLRGCRDPFWGRPGSRKPTGREFFRHTEARAAERKGVTPKSVFQIGGAGAVGTGSIRGMPHLADLRRAGFSVWPFHEVRAPVIVEIYPRLLTGEVVKSSFDARLKYLTTRCFPEIDGPIACRAASSEDAFDAAVSSVVMSRHLDEIRALTRSEDPTDLIEGAIWWPRRIHASGATAPGAAVARADCPFCDAPEDSVIAESHHAVAVLDGYPVSEGHTLVIPKAHSRSLFATSPEVQADVWRLVARVRDELQSRFNPDGFNVGLNDGPAAGQTVEHAHVHVIPRFDGDVADPRGGIRCVLPHSAAYWES